VDYAMSSSSGAYPYASGIRFGVNMNATKDNRVSYIEVNSQLKGDWSAVSTSKTYTVVTNNYISGGKDGYTEFTTDKNQVNTYREYAQSFIDYSLNAKTLVAPPVSEFSTQCFTHKNGSVFSKCTAALPPKNFSGSFTIKVSNATLFKTEPKVKDALREAIADTIAGVEKDHVHITLITNGRRLAAHGDAGTVKIEFDVVMPGTFKGDINPSSMVPATLMKAINTRVAAAGMTATVTEAPAVTGSAPATTAQPTISSARMLPMILGVSLPSLVGAFRF